MTRAALLLAVVVAVAGCAGAAYERAQQRDSEAAYREFIASYPDDPRAQEARARIDQLEREQAEFERASKDGSAAALQAFVDAHPRAHQVRAARDALEKAREKEAQEARLLERGVPAAIRTGDYPRLVELERFARRRGRRELADQARAELDRYAVKVVGPQGHLVTEAPSAASLPDPAAVVGVNCALAATTRRSAVTDRSFLMAAFEGNPKIAEADDAKAEREQAAALEGGMAELLLYPDDGDDSVVFRRGELKLRDVAENGSRMTHLKTRGRSQWQMESGPGIAASARTVHTATSLKRSRDQDLLFSAYGGSGSSSSGFTVALILVLPSRDSPGSLQATGQWWEVDTAAGVAGYVMISSERVPAVLSGSARLPRDRWTRLGPGPLARGGALRFEDGRVTLAPGTEILERTGPP